MDRLAKCPRPVVAAINGSCLGGGLEVALACRYRIATSSPKTRLGLPEVQLGLLPGAGGTQRLPKVVGIQQAITLMTTGQQCKPEKAKKLGLVNEVVDPSALQTVAIQAARELASGKLSAGKPKGGLMTWALEGNPLGRNLLFGKAEEMIKKASGGHYPAPLAILECVRQGVESGHEAGSAKEREGFGALGMTSVSKSLRGIFFGQTATKKNPAQLPAGTKAPEVKTVGILGAGLMGAGIAQVTTGAGLGVVLKDRDTAGLSRGLKQIGDNLAAKAKKRSITGFEKDLQLARVIGVSDEDKSWRAHIARADIVVEAVFEDLALKHRVIKDVEPSMKPTAVFATNTSALPVGSIAQAAARPERVLGLHYFSPVDKMPLLEIIPHAGTVPDALAMAFELGQKQGKTCIVVKDVPGFYVNRCLGPWAAEALLLAQSGVDPAALDAAVKAFGYPVGPVTLADEVGVDVLYHTYGTLKGALGVRMAGADDAWLKTMVENKWLGRKTGKGFYTYPAAPAKGKGKGKGESKQINPEAVALIQKYGSKGAAVPDMASCTERMVFRFMKECMHSLEDGIIRSPADGDIGAVFGLGFPPFLGGPFRYADALGAQKLADKMSGYADKLGAQFAPPQILLDNAKANKKFFK
jgi:enoyl-CoA hydratase/long-chain 3-hydroxyacyl-CoA dehydrogenase